MLDWKFSEEVVARKRLKTTALKQGALYISMLRLGCCLPPTSKFLATRLLSSKMMLNKRSVLVHREQNTSLSCLNLAHTMLILSH